MEIVTAARTDRWLPVLLAVGLNLLTLIGVVGLGWPPGNVMVLFWVENVVIGLCSLVKVATARGGTAAGSKAAGAGFTALFFCVHYGIFCVVHGVFTGLVAGQIGLALTFATFGIPAVLIGVRYTVETVVTWFGRGGQRDTTSPQQAMAQPYPRIIVLHLTVLAAFFLVLRDRTRGAFGEPEHPVLDLLDRLGGQAAGTGVAVIVLLVVIKSVVDIATTRRAVSRRPSP